MSKTRHILGISGGKDSAALAIHLKDKIPEMEYVFCDTGSELKETYEFIKRLEAHLDKKVIRLPKELDGFSDKYDFNHVLDLYGNYLPSPQARWCTKKLKLEPFEKYIGNDQAISYVGIRGDEEREQNSRRLDPRGSADLTSLMLNATMSNTSELKCSFFK